MHAAVLEWPRSRQRSGIRLDHEQRIPCYKIQEEGLGCGLEIGPEDRAKFREGPSSRAWQSHTHADRQFQCVECGQWLPLRLQQEHQDYHFAVALAGADGAMALPTDTGRSSVAGRPCTPQRSGAPQPRPRARPSLGKRPAPGVQTLGAWVVKRPRHAAD